LIELLIVKHSTFRRATDLNFFGQQKGFRGIKMPFDSLAIKLSPLHFM